MLWAEGQLGIRDQARCGNRPLTLKHQALPLELAGEVEFQMLEILLRHGEHIAGVGQEDVSSLSVTRHVLVLALLEMLQLILMTRLTLHPACLI